MKKDDLIKALQKLPGNTEVNLFDYRKNLHYDYGEGSSAGIYHDIEIEMVNEKCIKGQTPFATISFKNEEYSDDGEYIRESD